MMIYLYILGGFAWALLLLFHMDNAPPKTRLAFFLLMWASWPITMPVVAIFLTYQIYGMSKQSISNIPNQKPIDE